MLIDDEKKSRLPFRDCSSVPIEVQFYVASEIFHWHSMQSIASEVALQVVRLRGITVNADPRESTVRIDCNPDVGY